MKLCHTFFMAFLVWFFVCRSSEHPLLQLNKMLLSNGDKNCVTKSKFHFFSVVNCAANMSLWEAKKCPEFSWKCRRLNKVQSLQFYFVISSVHSMGIFTSLKRGTSFSEELSCSSAFVIDFNGFEFISISFDSIVFLLSHPPPYCVCAFVAVQFFLCSFSASQKFVYNCSMEITYT